MRRIEGYPLWIGTARDARDIKGVLDAGVEAIVDLAAMDEPVKPTRELVYLRFPLVDGADNPPWLVCSAIQAVVGLVKLGVPTLVACDDGMSRSIAIAAAAMWFRMPLKTSLDEVLAKLAADGPCDVQPRLWADVKRFVFVCGEGCYRPRE
jgi:hypothetical protein